MDQLFVAPTFLAAVSEAAAIRAGLYGDGGRRVLLTTNNSLVPEVSRSIEHAPGFSAIAETFDEILHLNDYITPMHPRGWLVPKSEAAPVVRRILKRAGLARDVGVTMQSLSVAPSLTIAKALPDSQITVVSDGLMSYGPAPKSLTDDVAARLNQLLYLELVPGLEPILFSEYGIRDTIIPTEAFTSVLADYAAAHPERARLAALEGTVDALVVGQYLAALDLVSVEEETQLYRDMVASAAELGHRRIVFKPHPSAPPAFADALFGVAAERGVEVSILDVPVPVEAIYAVARPEIVIGSFSTALATAALYGIRTASVGTAQIAQALPTYGDSNRVPLAITAATSDRIIERGGAVAVVPPLDVDLARLLRALAGTMHPMRYEKLRRSAERFAASAERSADLRPFFGSWQQSKTSLDFGMLMRAVVRKLPEGLTSPIRTRLSRFTRLQRDRIDRVKLAAKLEVPELTPEDFERERLGH